MKYSLFAIIIVFLAAMSPTMHAHADDVVPCEDMLAKLRDALGTAKPSESDAAKIKELQDKGIERCNADDDQRADEFFAQALKILGK
jgi:hypothetical protein